MITYSHSRVKNPLFCSICRRPIGNHEQVFQTNSYYGLICNDCKERFAGEDLDFIVNLFLAYGGYFGKFSRDQFSLDKLCQGMEKGGMDKFTAMQVKLFHNGLLYGITPKEVERIIERSLQDS